MWLDYSVSWGSVVKGLEAAVSRSDRNSLDKRCMPPSEYMHQVVTYDYKI